MNAVVSVVIPVFQNEQSVRESVTRILDQEANVEGVSLDVLLIEDGSTDQSWEVCQELTHQFPAQVSAIRLSRNFGQVRAISAGLENARGDAVVVISADLQDPISLIPEMIAAWKRGNDVVIAHRADRQDRLTSRMSSRIAYRVARQGGTTMPVGGFDYFLLSRRAVDTYNSYPSQHRFLQGDVLWMGFPALFIPYTRASRPHGKSTWTFGKKLKYFTDLLLDSSYWPIQFMSRLGIIIAAAGIVYAAIVTAAYFLNQTPFPGWAPIMVTLLVVGGIIMVMLGIVGEYVWRILDELKGKPLYIISEERGRITRDFEPESP